MKHQAQMTKHPAPPPIPSRVSVRFEGPLNAVIAANYQRWKESKPSRSWGRDGSLSRFIQEACREFHKGVKTL